MDLPENPLPSLPDSIYGELPHPIRQEHAIFGITRPFQHGGHFKKNNPPLLNPDYHYLIFSVNVFLNDNKRPFRRFLQELVFQGQFYDYLLTFLNPRAT